MSNTALKVPPPAAAAIGLAAQWLLTRSTEPRAVPGRRPLAATLALGAAATAGSAARTFRAQHTTLDPVHPEAASSVVMDGPFGRTRNPMYLGLLTLLLGNALRTGRWRALVPVAAVAGWLDRVQIPAEEAAMETKFGRDYTDYRNRVRRWL